MNSSPTRVTANNNMGPQQNFHDMEERGMRSPRDAREAREAARSAKNGAGSHFRRAQSPPPDEYRYSNDDEPRTPTSNTGVTLQDVVPPHAQPLQRGVPAGQQSQNPGQRRPQVTNGPPNRGGAKVPPTPRSQPPSYPGPPLEDGLQNHINAARYSQYRRQPGNGNSNPAVRRPSGSEPPPTASGALPRTTGSGSPPRPSGQRPQPQAMPDAQPRRPPSPGASSISGASINRLNSPSITKSVLQPLELKIHEYDSLMEEAQRQMMQLDEELRAMQQRRREAEERFLEAKAKHDDYERQHQDVGRALRGELGSVPRTIPRMETVESFEERPVSEQSSKMSGKLRARDRIRLSFFG